MRYYLWLFAAVAAFADTRIVDTIRSPFSNGLFNGTMTVVCSRAMAANGDPVAGGRTTLTIVNGALDITIHPYDFSTPATPCTVTYTSTDQLGNPVSSSERWTVPTSTHTLRISDVLIVGATPVPLNPAIVLTSKSYPDPAWITTLNWNKLYNLPITTRGDLIYYGASGVTRLGLGSNGTCIKSNGTDAYWGTCGGGVSTFDQLGSGTNTTAAMVVGAGASLSYTSTGYINANRLMGTSLSSISGVGKWSSGVPSAAAYSDVVTLWAGGSCTGYLKNDGTCASVSGAASQGSANALNVANGSGAWTDSGCTYSLSGGFVCPQNSSYAGAVDLYIGTNPGTVAGKASLVGPATGSAYTMVLPASSGLGTAGALQASASSTTPALSVRAWKGTDTYAATDAGDGSTGAALCRSSNGGVTATGCSAGGTTAIYAWAPFGYTASTQSSPNAGVSKYITVTAVNVPFAMSFQYLAAYVPTAAASGGGYQVQIMSYDLTSAICVFENAYYGASSPKNLGTIGVIKLAAVSGTGQSGGVCTLPAGTVAVAQTSDDTTVRISAIDSTGNGTGTIMSLAAMNAKYNGYANGSGVITGSGSTLTMPTNISALSFSGTANPPAIVLGR